MHLISWFHADSPDFRSRYAQTLGDPTSSAHRAVYERCLRVLYGSARRWNPAARLTLVTNVAAESVFSRSTIALLDRLEVARRAVPNTHRTPPGYHDRWQNQFFVLDVASAALEGVADEQEPVLVLDSDCVVTGPLPDDLVGPAGIAALGLPRRPDEAENGLTPVDLAALVDAVPGAAGRTGLPVYLGGELIAMRPAVLRPVLQRAEQVFQQSLRRREAGLSAVNEEAQLLTVAVHSLGLQWRQADFVARLWTQPWKFRTVAPGDERLLVWHLPAEKKTGIGRLDAAAARREGWFWTAPRDEWVRRAGGLVGVPAYGPGKLLRDAADLGRTRARRLRSAR